MPGTGSSPNDRLIFLEGSFLLVMFFLLGSPGAFSKSLFLELVFLANLIFFFGLVSCAFFSSMMSVNMVLYFFAGPIGFNVLKLLILLSRALCFVSLKSDSTREGF